MNYRNRSPQNNSINFSPKPSLSPKPNNESLKSDTRIHLSRYEEEKNRKAHENKRENFLRTSLTKSQRLRGLANKIRNDGTPISFENKAFDGNEYKGTSSSQLPNFLTELKEKRIFSEIRESKRINDREWEILENYFGKATVQKSLNTHEKIASCIESFKLKNPHLTAELKMIGEENIRGLVKTIEFNLKGILDRPRIKESSDVDLRKDTNQTCSLQESMHLLDILKDVNFKSLLISLEDVASLWLNDRKAVKDPREMSLINDNKNSDQNTPILDRNDNLYYDEDHENRRTTKVISDQEKVHETPLTGCYWHEFTTDRGIKLKRIIMRKPQNCPLGICVKNEGASIIINRILKGGMSDISEVFTEGDELVAMNGQELVSEDVDYVHDIFRDQSGQLELIIAPSSNMFAKMTKSLVNESSIFIRSLFSYDPESDVYLPCKDVGLEFTKGDILEVRCIKDSFWWQAYRLEQDNNREGPIDTRLCGIIPSPQYQYNRTIARIKSGNISDDIEVTYENLDEKYSQNPSINIIELFQSQSDLIWLKNGGAAYQYYQKLSEGLSTGADLSREKLEIWCHSGIIWGQLGYSLCDLKNNKKGFKSHNKTKAQPNDLKLSSGQDAEDPVQWLDEDEIIHSISHPCLLTYEPVVEFFPQPHRRRILVIIGSAQVGKSLIIDKLIEADSRRFVLPRIVTTNQSLPNSNNHQEYERISYATFEALFREDSFVEIGYFNKHFYGIKKQTLEDIVKQGKVAVVNLRPESLRRMRKTGLLPYVICLSPPNSGNELRRCRQIYDPNYECSVEELQYCIESNRLYETLYGHWFDHVEPVYNIDETVKNIRDVMIHLERNKQWIPRHWLKMAMGLAWKNKIDYATAHNSLEPISLV